MRYILAKRLQDLKKKTHRDYSPGIDHMKECQRVAINDMKIDQLRKFAGYK